jgi:SagB-type dehydrogenase family enzyme
MPRAATQTGATEIELPEPARSGSVSVEQAIAMRRSERSYAPQPLRLPEVAELLWAAQGITRPDGRRAAPSAGALYPLDAHWVSERVEGLEPGAYLHLPPERRLRLVARGRLLSGLAAAALGQDWIAEAAGALVLSAVYARTTIRYGERGRRYVVLEAGHALENAHLAATAQGLHSVVVGAFGDAAVAKLLGLAPDASPLCLLVVGRSV